MSVFTRTGGRNWQTYLSCSSRSARLSWDIFSSYLSVPMCFPASLAVRSRLSSQEAMTCGNFWKKIKALFFYISWKWWKLCRSLALSFVHFIEVHYKAYMPLLLSSVCNLCRGLFGVSKRVQRTCSSQTAPQSFKFFTHSRNPKTPLKNMSSWFIGVGNNIWTRRHETPHKNENNSRPSPLNDEMTSSRPLFTFYTIHLRQCLKEHPRRTSDHHQWDRVRDIHRRKKYVAKGRPKQPRRAREANLASVQPRLGVWNYSWRWRLPAPNPRKLSQEAVCSRIYSLYIACMWSVLCPVVPWFSPRPLASPFDLALYFIFLPFFLFSLYTFWLLLACPL